MNDVKALLQKIKADKEAAQNKKGGSSGQSPQEGGAGGSSQSGGGHAPRIQKQGNRGK